MVTESSLQGNVGMDGDNPVSPPFSKGPYNTDQDHDYKSLLQCSGHFGLNYNRKCLVEYFDRLPKLNANVGNDPANKHFEILGTNVAEGNVTFSTTLGAVELKTASGANDQVIVLPHLDSGQTAWTGTKWGTENQPIFEEVVRTGASVADTILWAGLKLTNTPTVATDDNQAFFRYAAASDTNWQAVYSIGGTDTSVDTGVAVAADTNVHFRIEIDSDRVAHFFIDNDEVATSTALTNDVDLIPYLGVQTTTTAQKILNLVGIGMSRIIFE